MNQFKVLVVPGHIRLVIRHDNGLTEVAEPILYSTPFPVVLARISSMLAENEEAIMKAGAPARDNSEDDDETNAV